MIFNLRNTMKITSRWRIRADRMFFSTLNRFVKCWCRYWIENVDRASRRFISLLLRWSSTIHTCRLRDQVFVWRSERLQSYFYQEFRYLLATFSAEISCKRKLYQSDWCSNFCGAKMMCFSNNYYCILLCHFFTDLPLCFCIRPMW